jgi:hypothetical protein
VQPKAGGSIPAPDRSEQCRQSGNGKRSFSILLENDIFYDADRDDQFDAVDLTFRF